MLRRPKRSKNEVVAPKEEEEYAAYYPIRAHTYFAAEAWNHALYANLWSENVYWRNHV